MVENSVSNRRSDSNEIHDKRIKNVHINRDQNQNRQAIYSQKNHEKRRDSDSKFENTSNRSKGMTSSVKRSANKRHDTNSNISHFASSSPYLGRTSDEQESNIKFKRYKLKA